MAIYDASLSGRHIEADLANNEAARSGFFTLIVDDIDNIVKASYSGDRENASSEDKIARAQEYLKLHVIATSVPHFSLEPLTFKRGNDTIKFAGTPTWTEGSIKVDDIVGLDTKSILMAWQNLAYDVHSSKGGRMIDYKKKCTLAEYTQDYQLIRSWTLYGCWISNINESDFDRENDGKRQLTATVEYDRAEMNLPDKVSA